MGGLARRAEAHLVAAKQVPPLLPYVIWLADCIFALTPILDARDMKLLRMAIPMLAVALTVSIAGAQQPAAPPPALPIPEVGTMAPDFDFTPVTLSGIGRATRLSALKGQTVVVWFFAKARSRG